MPKFILFCVFAFVLFSCQPHEHAKEIAAVDSLRIVLVSQRNLLASFPIDSLHWCSQQIDEQQMLLSNMTDSAHWMPYSNYFSLSASIKEIISWQSDINPILLENENRLQALKNAVKEKKGTDAKGNSITPTYIETCLATEKAHADSIGQGILKHYTQSIQAIQLVRWMSPIMKREIENSKGNQE